MFDRPGRKSRSKNLESDARNKSRPPTAFRRATKTNTTDILIQYMIPAKTGLK